MTTMPPMKVVLSNGEDDERELGPFNQGVRISHREIIDVATGKVIADQEHEEYTWWTQDDYKEFRDVYIQTYPAPPREGLNDLDPARAKEAFRGLVESRPLEISMDAHIERRLRMDAENFDVNSPEDPLERDDDGKHTDDALAIVAGGCIDAGLRLHEFWRGVTVRLDGTEVPGTDGQV